MKVKLTFLFDRRKKASKTKEAVVELRITAQGKRSYISTGVWLLKNQWSNGLVVNHKDWKQLNERLQMMYRKCSDVITKMMDEGCFNIKAVSGQLENSMTQSLTFLDYFKRFSEQKAREIKSSTHKRYDVVYGFLEESKVIVFFTDITEDNIRKLDDILTDRGLKESSRYNYHKIIKPCVHQALYDGLIKKDPYERVKVKRGDENGIVRCLTPKEFQQLESSKMPTKSLEQVKDVFVFQTYTMMSYCDLEKFDYKKAKRKGNSIIYTAKRQKTGKEFTFLLLDRAKEILKKYKYKLPILSNDKYNLYLKAVALHAGLDIKLTTHYSRHTGATMLLNDGISYEIIAKVLGDTIREVEKTYAKMLDDTIVQSMSAFQKRNLG